MNRPEPKANTRAFRKPKDFSLNPSLSDSDELGIQTEIFPADKSYEFGKSRKLASLGG